MNVALQLAVTLTSIDCGECGGTYAINERYRKQCADFGKAWHCPYCQTGWGYTGNSELQKAQKELAAERARKEAALARANTAEAAKLAAEKSLKRHKKRAANGTCPCCSRTFKGLGIHMARMHPDYVTENLNT